MTSTPSHERGHDRDAELDLAGAIDVLVSQRWLIGVVTAACFGAGALYAFLAPRQYQADIMVQVEDSPDASAASNVLGDVSSLFDVKSSAAAEAQILASRLVVTRAVDALRSYISVQPKRFPVVGEFASRFNRGLSRPGVFGVGGYAWGDESAELARFDVPKSLEGERFELSLLDGGRYRLTGAALSTPFIGTIGRPQTFSTGDGPIAVDVARIDAHPDTRFTLVRESRAETIDTLRRGLDVQEKVKQSGVIVATLRGPDPQRVQAQLQAVANHYIRQHIERKSADAAQSLSFLNAQLPALKQQLQDAEQRYTNLRNARGTVDLDAEAKLLLQQSADTATRQLELQQKRDEMGSRFAAGHPDMVALDAQIATLARERQALDHRVRGLPDLQQDAVRLMLDVKVDTDLYTALLANAQQLELVKAGKTGSVRIVDMPIVPEDSVRPNRPVVVAAAALIGLALGIALAFARDYLFGGVRNADEIERHLGLDVYATVPASAGQRQVARRIARRLPAPHLLSVLDPHDPAIESLRSLHTALRFAMQRARNNVLLLTGPVPGAGKSFVAANFAALLAAGGQRVLLVDGDLRKGYLHESLDLPREPGFAELLAGTVAPDDAIRRNVLPNLDFIATGTMPEHPAHRLADDRIAALLETLSARYDLVVLDTAPILAVGDAVALGRHAGTVLLAARAASTRVAELEEAVRRLAHNGVAANGVVLNGVDPRTGRYGSRHGVYHYAHYRYAPSPPSRRGAAASIRRALLTIGSRFRRGGKQ